MNISQAESAIGATVAYLGGRSVEVGVISSVNEKFAFVTFDRWAALERDGEFHFVFRVGKATYACYPHDLVFYYGPLMQQIVRNMLIKEDALAE